VATGVASADALLLAFELADWLALGDAPVQAARATMTPNPMTPFHDDRITCRLLFLWAPFVTGLRVEPPIGSSSEKPELYRKHEYTRGP
jgi:hypothetical protein